MAYRYMVIIFHMQPEMIFVKEIILLGEEGVYKNELKLWCSAGTRYTDDISISTKYGKYLDRAQGLLHVRTGR